MSERERQRKTEGKRETEGDRITSPRIAHARIANFHMGTGFSLGSRCLFLKCLFLYFFPNGIPFDENLQFSFKNLFLCIRGCAYKSKCMRAWVCGYASICPTSDNPCLYLRSERGLCSARTCNRILRIKSKDRVEPQNEETKRLPGNDKYNRRFLL